MHTSRSKHSHDLEGQDTPFRDGEREWERNNSDFLVEDDLASRLSSGDDEHDYPPWVQPSSPVYEQPDELKRRKWSRIVFFILMIYFLYASVRLFQMAEPGDWPWGPASGARPVQRPPNSPPVVYDLLDPTVYVKTPGQSLLERGHVNWGPYTLIIPDDDIAWTAQAGKPFTLVVQCDASIIGQEACSPQYVVHLRGPVAEAVPSNPSLYKHDPTTGTTEIKYTLAQAGFYDVWMTPEGIGKPDCPDKDQHSTVKGSGQRPLHVVGALGLSGLVRDELYRISSPSTSRRRGFKATCKVEASADLDPLVVPKPLTSWEPHPQTLISADTNLTTTDQYIYAPYRCKQRRLDVAYSLDYLPSVKHVTYIGDSILRSSFCGHLYSSLHDGQEEGDCLFSNDLKTYQHAPKTFEYPIATVEDDRGGVRFSMRFLTGEFDKWQDALANLTAPGVPPVTHVIVNVGLWLVLIGEERYMQSVAQLLDYVQTFASPSVHIIWVSTPSGKVPSDQDGFIDYYRLTDARPETSTDGRNEPLPWMYDTRPWVGAADNALFQWAWDIWRV
ncbi:BQ2448_395 [Microbotryum intermedium]|uniref:BQ2448_395 protein n=1 Tax=Microbotryum intermedium TaxID=269621 RepID=A0A238F8R7_9BASI|nr:BQ2448_395 [Microbotryum intermedium]